MKVIWLVTGILFMLLTLSTGLFIYTNIIYNDLQESLDLLEKEVQKERWERADKESLRLQEIWSRADAYWTPIMDHRDVDRLDESINRLQKILELRQKEDALLEISTARRLTLRLKDKETPGIRNVF